MAEGKTRMEDKIDSIDRAQARLEERLVGHIENEDRYQKEIRDTLKEVSAHLQEYNIQLKVHIAGTEDNRVQITNHQKEIDTLKTQSLTVKVSWQTILKVGGVILAILSAVAAIEKFIK